MQFKGKIITSLDRPPDIRLGPGGRSHDHVLIDWVLGNYCNYSCSYCFPESNTGTHPVPKLNDTIKSNIDHLIQELHNVNRKDIVFSLSGGEPTLYKQFIPLTQHIHDLGCKIGIVTNGSRSLKWWQRGVEHVQQIMLSIHHEHADIDHICKVVDCLTQQDKHVTLYVMTHFEPTLFEKSIETLARVVEQYKHTPNVRITIKLLRDLNNTTNWYTQQQLDRVDSLSSTHPQQVRKLKGPIRIPREYNFDDGTNLNLSNNASLNQQHLSGSWQGYTCLAPHDFVQIRADGIVGKMSCGQSYTSPQNLYSEDFKKFKLPSLGVTCKVHGQCGCIGLANSRKLLSH